MVGIAVLCGNDLKFWNDRQHTLLAHWAHA